MTLLTGVRVLDLSRLLPGPLATMQLADQGADVIKIEDANAGDYARTSMAFTTSMSHLFHVLNRAKRSIAIDLRTEPGRTLVLDLVETADAVVESFRPGTLEAMGLGYDVLKARKPNIIVCSISAYGQTGAYAKRPGHDINMCALSGVAHQSGAADGPPTLGNFQIADIAGGAMTAANAILAALFRRERTGAGAHLDVAMAGAALSLAVMPLATGQLRGGAPPGRGDDLLTGALACYRYYETQDGRYMSVGALEQKFWAVVCARLGLQHLTGKRLAFGEDGTAVHAEVAAAFLSQPLSHWTEVFADGGGCVEPVLDPGEARAHPWADSRGLTYRVDDPVDGPITHTAAAFGVDGKVARPQTIAPRHGEHGIEILQALGGYPKDAITDLIASGVLVGCDDATDED